MMTITACVGQVKKLSRQIPPYSDASLLVVSTIVVPTRWHAWCKTYIFKAQQTLRRDFIVCGFHFVRLRANTRSIYSLQVHVLVQRTERILYGSTRHHCTACYDLSTFHVQSVSDMVSDGNDDAMKENGRCEVSVDSQCSAAAVRRVSKAPAVASALHSAMWLMPLIGRARSWQLESSTALP
jgi:hypothetical protein